MFKLRTVRSKIVLLLIVGLIGILTNAGVNRYTGKIKDAYYDLTRHSQAIKLQVLDTLGLEQQIINRRDAEVFKKLRKAEDQLLDSIALLKNSLVDQTLHDLVAELESAQNHHLKLFQQITENLGRMDDSRNTMADASGKVSTTMTEIVDGIVAEETNLMMTGEDLPAVKRSFRDLAKDLLISINLKTLNLQDLFVLGDAGQYQTQQQELAKRLGQDR